MDQRQLNLFASQKKLLRWSKCQVYTAYLWTFLNGVTVIVNLLAILTFLSWNELSFLDDEGQMHTLRFGKGGLIFLTLLKVIGCALCVQWGLDALKTFRPIV